MIRPVESPGLGWILVYDEASPPGFGQGMLPAFHVDELALLRKCKAAKLTEWRAVCDVKLVFPGARVVEAIDYVANRKRFEQRMKRRQTWRSRPEPPEPDEPADE